VSCYFSIIGSLDMEENYSDVKIPLAITTFLFSVAFIGHSIYFCYKCDAAIQEVLFILFKIKAAKFMHKL